MCVCVEVCMHACMNKTGNEAPVTWEEKGVCVIPWVGMAIGNGVSGLLGMFV